MIPIHFLILSTAGQSESAEGIEPTVQRTSTPPVGGWANFGDFEKKQQSEEEAGGGGGGGGEGE